MKTLSICIPTRNRPEALTRTFQAIQKQLTDLNAFDQVEIVICDNTDQESMRIDPQILAGEHVRYFKNVGNLGYARNINQVIFKASGQYVWLLADDDYVLEGAVASILERLQGQDVVNYATFYSAAEGCGSRDKNFYFKDCPQHDFVMGSDFLKRYWLSVIFVSVNIFHRQRLIDHARAHDLFDKINDVYQNSLLCLSFINNFGQVTIIPQTLLSDSYQHKFYLPYASVNTPVHNYVKLLTQLSVLGMDQHVLRLMRKDVISSVVYNGLRFVIRKTETPDDFDYAAEYTQVFSQTGLDKRVRLSAGMIFMILKLPKGIARVLVKMIFTIKGRQDLYAAIRKESLQWYEQLKDAKVSISY